MKKKNTLIFLLAFLIPSVVLGAKIKEHSVSGLFYPSNPKELSSMLEELLLKAAPEKLSQKPAIIIVPHAGYGYSGQTAAFGYKLLERGDYRTVVIIGTGHKSAFSGISVYPDGAFSTPLGSVEIDKIFADKLINKEKNIYFYRQAFQEEHSVEVQLPFLQKTLKNFKIVPVIMGDCLYEDCSKFASLLKEAIGARKDVLIVVSSDLYHGYDYEEAENIDNFTLSLIKNLEPEGLYYGLRDGKVQACGGFGIVSALIFAKEAGFESVKVLNYTNSAKVTGKIKKGVWTVGYASLSISKAAKEAFMLNDRQKKRLLEIARTTISNYLKNGKKPDLHEDDPDLNRGLGAFVTLHKKGELRGCIGNLTGNKPLYLTIRDMAVESATQDPRFSPLTLSELGEVNIEISVLSPLKKETNPDNIRMGIDGVIIRKGFRSGVFLPQVATETGWSRDEFMSNLCMHKAGLPADAWKNKDTDIFTFTAEVFKED